jgi:hypothetical protein
MELKRKERISDRLSFSEKIETLMNEQAAYEGCTVEELKQRWLSEESFGQGVEEVEG